MSPLHFFSDSPHFSRSLGDKCTREAKGKEKELVDDVGLRYDQDSHLPPHTVSSHKSQPQYSSSFRKPRNSFISFVRSKPSHKPQTSPPLVLSEVIEITRPHSYVEEEEERERLRDAAAQSIGLIEYATSDHYQEELDSEEQPPTTFDLSPSSPLPTSLTSPASPPLPPFPASLASLAGCITLAGTFPKFFPPSSLLVYALAKQWKSRFIILTTALKGPSQSETVTYLHLFKSNHLSSYELHRLPITQDTAIYVAEQSGPSRKRDGRGGGMRASGAKPSGTVVAIEQGSFVWHFEMQDSCERQQWIGAIKAVVLGQRSARAGIPAAPYTISGHEPRGDMDVMLSMRTQQASLSSGTSPLSPGSSVSLPRSSASSRSLSRSPSSSPPIPSALLLADATSPSVPLSKPLIRPSPSLEGLRSQHTISPNTTAKLELLTRKSSKKSQNPSTRTSSSSSSGPRSGSSSPTHSIQLYSKRMGNLSAVMLNNNNTHTSVQTHSARSSTSTTRTIRGIFTPRSRSPSLSEGEGEHAEESFGTVGYSLMNVGMDAVMGMGVNINRSGSPMGVGMTINRSGSPMGVGMTINRSGSPMGVGMTINRGGSPMGVGVNIIRGGSPVGRTESPVPSLVSSVHDGSSGIMSNGSIHNGSVYNGATPSIYNGNGSINGIPATDLKIVKEDERCSPSPSPSPPIHVSSLPPQSTPPHSLQPPPRKKNATIHPLADTIYQITDIADDFIVPSSTEDLAATTASTPVLAPDPARLSVLTTSTTTSGSGMERSGSISSTPSRRWSRTLPKRLTPPSGPLPLTPQLPHELELSLSSSPSSLDSPGAVVWKRTSGSSSMSNTSVRSNPVHTYSVQRAGVGLGLGGGKRRSMPPPRPAPSFAPPPAPEQQQPQKMSFRTSVAQRALRLSLTAPRPPPSGVLPPRPDEPAHTHAHHRSSSGNSADIPLPSSPPPRPDSAASSRSISIKQRLRILSAPSPSTLQHDTAPESPITITNTEFYTSAANGSGIGSSTHSRSPTPPLPGTPITTMQNHPSFLQLATATLPAIPPRNPLRLHSTERLASAPEITSLSPPPRRGSKMLAAQHLPEKVESELPDFSDIRAEAGSVVSLGFVAV